MSRSMKSGILRQLDSHVCQVRWHAVLLKRSFLSKYKLANIQSFLQII